VHTFRWDLDKTYLVTEFGSVRALVRAALEPASAKRNVSGSAALLRALQEHDPTSRTEVISGSPTQMRRVLTEKLAMDGIRVDRLTLKDNLGNLRRGRLRAVWGQVGYKLPELLRRRGERDPADTETLFGDDAEVDAAVYAVYADAISGRIGPDTLRAVLEGGGAYSDDVDRALEALERAPRGDAVEDIFIRLDEGGPVQRFAVLGPRVTPVFSWLQAALVLWRRRRLDPEGVAAVVARCAETDGLTELGVAGLVQDAVRRGLCRAPDLEPLWSDAPTLAPLRTVVDRTLALLGEVPDPPVSAGPSDPLAFLRATR
jgi:hypothetical protein